MKRNIIREPISIYVRNSKLGPSDYYRICQFVRDFQHSCVINDAVNEKEFQRNLNMENGVAKRLYQIILFVKIYIRRLFSICRDLLCGRSVVIVHREMFPHKIGFFASRLLRRLCKRAFLFWDFDDDIFCNNEISTVERNILEQYSDSIIVTSKYLMGLLNSNGREKVTILPTTDGFNRKYDLYSMLRQRTISFDQEIVLSWVGTAGNLVHLDMVIDKIDQAARILRDEYKKKLVLKVVCNKNYKYKTNCLEIKSIIWSREIAEDTIVNAHIGIMPLRSTKYALGKGGFKLVQYISVGLPVIASAVGYNNEIITSDMGIAINNDNLDDWVVKLVELSRDKERWLAMSKAAYSRYEKHFSYYTNASTWEKMIDRALELK